MAEKRSNILNHFKDMKKRKSVPVGVMNCRYLEAGQGNSHVGDLLYWYR